MSSQETDHVSPTEVEKRKNYRFYRRFFSPSGVGATGGATNRANEAEALRAKVLTEDEARRCGRQHCPPARAARVTAREDRGFARP
jgi:hypothetical protein